ncbi:MAG: peptidyl-prolyl cis-trans isomerase [Candidatus Omnitrophica bacterium]|nr:peptidyl-prolyl cis-trans isomerase [Candidatus Omnitrophota bacterium]
MRKSFNLLAICLVCVVFFLGCEQISAIKEYFKGDSEKSADAPVVDAAKPAADQVVMTPETIARVGNWTITREEFKERVKALKEVVPDFDVASLEARKMVIDELVRQQLLVIDAEKAGIANSKDIKDAVAEFRRTLIVREAAQKLVEGIVVTDEEAQAFYNENKEQLIQPPQFHVKEIVVKEKALADALVAELANGADFAAKAKENSISQTAPNGGDVGFIDSVPFESMAPVLMEMAKGEISEAVESPTGEFYIVKLEDKREGRQLEFEEIKNDIIQNQTLLKQQQKLLDKLEALQKEIKVEVNYDLLK